MEHRAILAAYIQVNSNSSTELVKEATFTAAGNRSIDAMLKSQPKTSYTTFKFGKKTFFKDRPSIQLSLTPKNALHYLGKNTRTKLDIIKADNYNLTDFIVYGDYRLIHGYTFLNIPHPIFIGTDDKGESIAIKNGIVYRQNKQKEHFLSKNANNITQEQILKKFGTGYIENSDGSINMTSLNIGSNKKGFRFPTGLVVAFNNIPDNIKIQHVGELFLGPKADLDNLYNLPQSIKTFTIYGKRSEGTEIFIPGLKNVEKLEKLKLMGPFFEFNQWRDIKSLQECLMYMTETQNFEGSPIISELILSKSLIHSFKGLEKSQNLNLALAVDRDKFPISFEGLPSVVNNFILMTSHRNLYRLAETNLTGFPSTINNNFIINEALFSMLSNQFKKIGLSDIVKGEIYLTNVKRQLQSAGANIEHILDHVPYIGSIKDSFGTYIEHGLKWGDTRKLENVERLKYSKEYTAALSKNKAADDWDLNM